MCNCRHLSFWARGNGIDVTKGNGSALREDIFDSPRLPSDRPPPSRSYCPHVSADLSPMRGAVYLCPLLGYERENAAESGVESANQVDNVVIDPIELAQAPSEQCIQQLASLLAGSHSDLVPQSSAANLIVSTEALDRLPPWAKEVLRLGGAGKPTTSYQHKRSSGDGDETSRKKPRAFQSRDSLLVNADNRSALSPEVIDLGDEDEDGSVRSTFTQEERVAEHVGKYSDVLVRLLEVVKHRHEENDVAGNVNGVIDLFSSKDVKTLVQSLKVMHKSSLIAKCDLELLLQLSSFMDRQVQIGISLDVLGTMSLDHDDEEWQTCGIDLRLVARVQSSLDVGICELLVMSTPDIDRRIMSEDSIKNCTQLLNHTLHRLILPCIDPSLTTMCRTPRSSLDTTFIVEKSSSNGGVSTKARNGLNQFNVKHNKNAKQAMDKLLPVVCDFMEHMSNLVLAVKLDDQRILQLSSIMTGLFALESGSYSSLLQGSALIVIRAIYLKYSSLTHRSLVLENLVGVMLQLPTAKRNLRTVKLSHSPTCVQMITTLVVALVQVSASMPSCQEASITGPQRDPTLLPDDVDFNDVNEPQATGQAQDKDSLARIDDARRSAKIFVAALIKECMKKNEERDNRVVLENFVEDLLAMFGRPEWAGAEVLLEVLSTSLVGILHTNLSKDAKKLESQYSLTALSLVGRICASIKMNANAAARDGFDDQGSALVYGEHETHLQRLFDTAYEASGDAQDGRCVVERNDVLKHIVLTYMRRQLSDIASEDSRRLLVTQFLLEKSSTSMGCYAREMWKNFWETKPSKAIDTSTKLAPPQHDLALRASLHLSITRDFAAMFDLLMSHLMALLSRGIPTFRARVMKALSGIVDVDPLLMTERIVQSAVSQCFLDEATSVRQAAVDLVGKYITSHPLLLDKYFERLCERLRDKGISVRKSVCRILRSYLTLPTQTDILDESLSEDDLRRRSECMRHLVQRIGDATEEDAIKNFIIDTFQETWFGAEFSSKQLSGSNGFEDEPVGRVHSDAPPGWTTFESIGEARDEGVREATFSITKSRSVQFLSPDGKIFSSAEEAWAAYHTPQITPSSVVRTKRSKHDDTPATVATIIEVIHGIPTMDWFISLLRRLLLEDRPSSSTRRASRDRSDDVSVARSRSEKIVSCLIDCLLQLEEGKELKGVTIADRDAQFISCVKALSAFSESCPILLTTHLESVMVYLKGDDKFSKSTESRVQGLVVGMICNEIIHSERVSDRIATRLEIDLKKLVYCAPPSVVGPSIKCLAALSNHTKRPPTLLFTLMGEFFKYLDKFQRLDSLKALKSEAKASLQRALFATGQIGGAVDFDNCTFDLPQHDVPPLDKLRKGHTMEALYQLYSVYLKIPGDPACTSKAVQGFGFLFMLRPFFLMRAQAEGLLDALLRNTAQEVQLQTLTSLKDLLQHEERRLEKGVSRKKSANRDKSRKGQVQGDQDGEGSLIGGVMQAQIHNVLALTLQRNVRIRSEAVSCVAVLLTQGLVSPLHCIPNLVALETDQTVSIRDVAHGQLLALHEKFPTQIHQPAVKGIIMSYEFQVNAFGSSTVFALDKDKREYCLYGRLYTGCLRPGRTQRNMFLRALLNQFYEKGTVTSNHESSGLKWIQYLSYLAQLVASLPFDVEDEPLFIIYHINRYVTLKLGSTLQDMQKGFRSLGVKGLDAKQEEVDLSAIDIAQYKDLVLSKELVKDLFTRCCVGYAISLLLRIKFFLKDMYMLDNEKCQTYQPGAATKATDQSLFVPENSSLQLQLQPIETLTNMDPYTLELSWKLLLLTWQAAQEDQNQLDFEAHDEMTRSKKKKPSRRRKAVNKSLVVNDDDEEIVEGFDG